MKLTDRQIKHMVDRFLRWKLPATFNPDGGVTFVRHRYGHEYEPIGTNLLSAVEAEAMVRHLVDGLIDGTS